MSNEPKLLKRKATYSFVVGLIRDGWHGYMLYKDDYENCQYPFGFGMAGKDNKFAIKIPWKIYDKLVKKYRIKYKGDLGPDAFMFDFTNKRWSCRDDAVKAREEKEVEEND